VHNLDRRYFCFEETQLGIDDAEFQLRGGTSILVFMKDIFKNIFYIINSISVSKAGYGCVLNKIERSHVINSVNVVSMRMGI